jgi:hypothetical protein
VAPGGNYDQMAVSYEGIEGLSVAEDASSRMGFGGDGVHGMMHPTSIRRLIGIGAEVAGQFVLLDSGAYSFDVTGTVDLEHELVIDPDLAWSAYLGGDT